jgi:hypothetical protein
MSEGGLIRSSSLEEAPNLAKKIYEKDGTTNVSMV